MSKGDASDFRRQTLRSAVFCMASISITIDHARASSRHEPARWPGVTMASAVDGRESVSEELRGDVADDSEDDRQPCIGFRQSAAVWGVRRSADPGRARVVVHQSA
jgi:hypothetical protein